MKRITIVLGLLITGLLFSGCSAQKAEIPVTQTAQSLSSQATFSAPLSPLPLDAALRLYEIPAEDVQEAAVYVGTGGAAVDEVSVWKAVDEAAAKRIEQKIRERLEAQKEVYADYQPGEVPKLEHPLLLVRGNVVVLCVSGNTEQAQDIVEQSRQG